VPADGKQITTIAGTGREGNELVEDNPVDSQLSTPSGVAVVGNGDVIIADTGNNRVLRVSADGKQITPIAGTGEKGNELFEDDPMSSQLAWPFGVAVIGNDDVIIADTRNKRVLCLFADGRMGEIDRAVAEVRNGLSDSVVSARKRIEGQLWMFSLLTMRDDEDQLWSGQPLARFFRTLPIASQLDLSVFKRISDYIYNPNSGNFLMGYFRVGLQRIARLMSAHEDRRKALEHHLNRQKKE